MSADRISSDARIHGVSVRQRRERERAVRHELIVRTARELAESEGWDAVTTRRLSERIEYSQPVLYSHFAGKDAIVAAVAEQGFAELAGARAAAGTAKEAVVGAIHTYLAFAEANPALYDAMFVLGTEPTCRSRRPRRPHHCWQRSVSSTTCSRHSRATGTPACSPRSGGARCTAARSDSR